MAGRLSWIAGRRLQLDCNAMGAELIEAGSSDKISDFGDFVDCSKTMFRDLVPHLDYEKTPIQELPLLSVQVTRFACGGICLGIQFSHVLMDGRSVFHFLKEWARLARGEPLEVPPYLDRVALKYVAPETMEIPCADGALAQVVADCYSTNEPNELMSPTLVLLSGDRIGSLKKIANQDHVAEIHGHPYSRFEVITAHVWKCMTKARELENEHITTLYVDADGRTRLDPTLPSSYFGNVLVTVASSASAGELVSRPLSYACSKVREAVKQLTNQYIRDTIEFFGKQENLRIHQFGDDRGDLVGSYKRSNDMWVTSSLNLLAQGLDFGWGKEVYAGPPTGLNDFGNTLILPHMASCGSLKIAIWLKHEKECSKFIKLCAGVDDKMT